MSMIKTISEYSSRCSVVESKALPCVIQNPMNTTGELQVSKSHSSMTVGLRLPMGYTSSTDDLRTSVTDIRCILIAKLAHINISLWDRYSQLFQVSINAHPRITERQAETQNPSKLLS